MQEKKQTILLILEKLFDNWDLAKPMYMLVDSQYCDEILLDGLLKVMNESLRSIKDKQKASNLRKAVNKIRDIKKIEEEEREEEKKNCEKFLEEIVF